MMTIGGPWPGMPMPQKPPIDTKGFEELHYEIMQAIRILTKRIEFIEEKIGISRKPETPCPCCLVLNAHQPWCEKNANRPSGT